MHLGKSLLQCTYINLIAALNSEFVSNPSNLVAEKIVTYITYDINYEHLKIELNLDSSVFDNSERT